MSATKLVSCLLSFLLVLQAVSGTTYYVSIFGSDRNNGLTPQTPFLTLQQCENVVKDGDMVHLLPGVFEGYQNCIDWDVANITLQGPASIACSEGMSATSHDMEFRNISILSTTSSLGTYISLSGANYTFDSCFFGIALDFYSANGNISHCQFSGDSSIYHYIGNLHLTNSYADGSGSIQSYYSTIQIHHASFPNWGVNSYADITFVANNTKFSSLTISYLGGTEFEYEDVPNAGECRIHDLELTCSSTLYGLYLSSSNCSIHNLSVHSCVASYYYPASGLLLYSTYSNFSSAHIFNNFGNSAVYVSEYSNVTFANSTFSGNQGNATTQGGAIHIAGSTTILNSQFRGNLAYDGGAFFLANDATVFVENSTIEQNVAYYAGAYDCAPNTNAGAISFLNVQVVDNLSISGEGDICPTA